MQDLKSLIETLRQQGASWRAGPTRFTGLPEEQLKLWLGCRPGPGEPSFEEAERLARDNYEEFKARRGRERVRYPVRFDWRNRSGHDYTSPIKDQGPCGSCVAFGTSSAVEGALRASCWEPRMPVHCSEAHLFYGYAHDEGWNCISGWTISGAFSGFERGVTDASLYPYTAGDQPFRLPENWKIGYSVARAEITRDLGQAKEYLSSQGMLVARFTVYSDFYFYRGGVYRPTPDATPTSGHCVCVIGYDDMDQCWICQNSWGTDWGDQGFFRIGYGECGIDAFFWLPRDVSRPSEVGTPLTNRVRMTAAPHADKRMQLWVASRSFAWSSSMRSADAESGWTDWTTYWPQTLLPMPGIQAAQIIAAPRGDQRLQLWVLGGDGTLWSVQQRSMEPSAEWSAWQPPIPAPAGVRPAQVAVGRLSDGRLQLWLLAQDGSLWSMWEWRSGSQLQWTSWSRFKTAPGARVIQFATLPLSNGALQLFAVGEDGRIQSCWKQDAHPDASWSPWVPFQEVSGKKVVQIVGARLSDKRPQLFALLQTGAISTCWRQQTAWDSPWTQWREFRGPGEMSILSLASGELPDKRTVLWAGTPMSRESFVIWTCRKQTSASDSSWTSWKQELLPILGEVEVRPLEQEEEVRAQWPAEEGTAYTPAP